MVDLPIAEVFDSIQGEGRWTGTPMRFIRLAGCSVGKPQVNAPLLKTKKPAWRCCSYTGERFWCDTDFNRYDWKNAEQLFIDSNHEHFCLTGGEPLMHLSNLAELVNATAQRGVMLHVETSGTIDTTLLRSGYEHVWITCSPKQLAIKEVIEDADEIKLLIDTTTNVNNLPYFVRNHSLVYIQPINNETSLNPANIARCLQLLQVHPSWKLSLQLHKVIGVR